jgi:hypothetical protein
MLTIIKAALGKYLWAIELAAVAGVVVFVFSLEARVSGLKAQLAEAVAARATDRAVMATAAASASEAARAREHLTVADQSENLNEAERLSNRARTDAVAAGVSDAGLRVAARAAAAGCDRVPGTATAAASSPADRLADLLGESAGRYREVAAELDDAVIRGRLCTADYDALMPK